MKILRGRSPCCLPGRRARAHHKPERDDNGSKKRAYMYKAMYKRLQKMYKQVCGKAAAVNGLPTAKRCTLFIYIHHPPINATTPEGTTPEHHAQRSAAIDDDDDDDE